MGDEERVHEEEEGWTGTGQAARALERSPRTIRRYIDSGELVARATLNGGVREWEVSIRSLKALRDKLIALGRLRKEAAGVDVEEEPVLGEAPEEAEAVASVFERLAERIEEVARKNAELEGQIQLRRVADSTRDQEVERLKEERDLAWELLEEERSKPWWRRIFG